MKRVEIRVPRSYLHRHDWSLDAVVQQSPVPAQVETSIERIIDKVVTSARAGARVVVMSNGGFAGIHQKLATALVARHG